METLVCSSRVKIISLPVTVPTHLVQANEESDAVKRVECLRVLNSDTRWPRSNTHPHYLKRILWTDESKFDHDGITNLHNANY